MKKCTGKAKTAKKAAATQVEKKPTARKTAPRKTKENGTAVAFTLHADAGKEVFLAGSFNEWNPAAKKMTFKDGIYRTTVRLVPGEYQYKFVVDGIWCADPANINSVPNDCGTFNSVITVG